MKTSFSFIGAWLALGAVLALGSRCYAQALTTNSMPVGTNGAAPIANVKRAVPFAHPFASAILEHPGVTLPEQGPWTLSESDLKQPLGLTQDLVKHSDPMFLFLWNLLSSNTQSAMEQERASIVPRVTYKPGPGIKVLVTNLNQLIQGKLIYDEQEFATIKPYLCGDTVKLLNQPDGTNVARLNRLLLEDAFPLDIARRPKILFDTNSLDYIFVDFAEQTVSLYGQDGGKEWTANLGHLINGVWNVSPQPDMILVSDVGVVVTTYRIDWDTGQVHRLPNF